jgi:hypothetical protein
MQEYEKIDKVFPSENEAPIASRTSPEFEALYKFFGAIQVTEAGTYEGQKKEDITRYLLKRYVDVKEVSRDFKDLLTKIRNEKITPELKKAMSEFIGSPMPDYLRKTCNEQVMNDFIKHLEKE